MDSEQVAIVCLRDGYCVVEVLRARAVYGEYGQSAQVFAVVQAELLHAALRYLLCLPERLRGKFARCAVDIEYRLRTRRRELAAAEYRGYLYLVLGVASAAEYYLREHLVALSERHRAVPDYYHVVALCDIGHEIELAVGFLYPARECRAAEAEYILDFALGLARARGYICYQHSVARHRAEHTLARDEVFCAVVCHSKAECAAQARHLADFQPEVGTERRLDALADRYHALVAELRERCDEVFPVVFLGAALRFELCYGHRALAVLPQKRDYLVLVALDAHRRALLFRRFFLCFSCHIFPFLS